MPDALDCGRGLGRYPQGVPGICRGFQIAVGLGELHSSDSINHAKDHRLRTSRSSQTERIVT